jgi:hypothetical protein
VTARRLALAAVALAAIGAASPADAGGVLLCNWLGCRSVVEFPRPVFVPYAPAVFMPPPGAEQAFKPPPAPATVYGLNAPPAAGPMSGYGPPPPDGSGPPVRFGDRALSTLAGPPGRASGRPSPAYGQPGSRALMGCHDIGCRGAKAPPIETRQRAPQPGPDAMAEREGREIEGDIRAFCDRNPSEPFCQKLTDYLRRNPGPPR